MFVRPSVKMGHQDVHIATEFATANVAPTNPEEKARNNFIDGRLDNISYFLHFQTRHFFEKFVVVLETGLLFGRKIMNVCPDIIQCSIPLLHRKQLPY